VQLWIVLVEVSVSPGTLESGCTLAFTNWVTWAEAPEQAIAQVNEVAASYDWHVLGVERIEPFDDALDYEEAISELVERARANPKAVLFGTFHSYPPQ